MALTSITTPTDYDIAYRPVLFEVETSVVDLEAVEFSLYDNTTSDLINSITVQAKFGDTDNFQVDMRTFIQDYLRADIDIITPNQTHFNSGLSIRDFYITATEKILTSSGTFNDGDTLTSSGYWIVNAALNVGDSGLVATEHFTTISGTKILTDKPTFEIREGESEFVSLYNNKENVKVTVVTTDTAGIMATGVVNSLTLGNQTCYLGIGYTNINALTLNTGTQPLIDSDTESYTVQFETVTTNTIFQQISVNIDKGFRISPVRFVFQNNYGALDFFTCYAFKEQSIDIESSISQRPVTDYTSITSYGKFRPNTSMNTRFRVGTQNLLASELQWLKQMFSSAGVWIQDGTQYRPIVLITDSLMIESNLQGQEVFNVQFEYELANALRRQKG